MSTTKKLILVIGATGAQGKHVIDAILATSADGTPSPYSVRALTRDPASERAKALTAKGVECVKGSFDDFVSVKSAFEGAYGAWVNTDGFTVGEQKEIYIGMRIYEIAKQSKSMRHYMWSGLDYATKKGGYNLDYKVEHFDGKGRVTDWLEAQPSVVSDSDMSWTAISSCVYMEMLTSFLFAALTKHADGTLVFASPVGDGHVSFIALSDLAFFVRYTLDHRTETSGKNLEVASAAVGWEDLVKTFTKVTGQPAIYKRQTLDEWWLNFTNIDKPVANEMPEGQGYTTTRQNFSAFWRMWRDDVATRDFEWLKSIHPELKTLEQWMRETDYQGVIVKSPLLKNMEDGKGLIRINLEKVNAL